MASRTVRLARQLGRFVTVAVNSRRSLGSTRAICRMSLLFLIPSGCCIYTITPHPIHLPPHRLAMQHTASTSEVQFGEESLEWIPDDTIVDEGLGDPSIVDEYGVTIGPVEMPPPESPTPAKRDEKSTTVEEPLDDADESPFESDEAPVEEEIPPMENEAGDATSSPSGDDLPSETLDVEPEMVPAEPANESDKSGRSNARRRSTSSFLSTATHADELLELTPPTASLSLRGNQGEETALFLGNPQVALQPPSNPRRIVGNDSQSSTDDADNYRPVSDHEGIFGPTASHGVTFTIPTRPIDASIDGNSANGWQLSANRPPRRDRRLGSHQANELVLEAPDNMEREPILAPPIVAGPVLTLPTQSRSLNPIGALVQTDESALSLEPLPMDEQVSHASHVSPIEVISNDDHHDQSNTSKALSNPFDDPFGDRRSP